MSETQKHCWRVLVSREAGDVRPFLNDLFPSGAFEVIEADGDVLRWLTQGRGDLAVLDAVPGPGLADLLGRAVAAGAAPLLLLGPAGAAPGGLPETPLVVAWSPDQAVAGEGQAAFLRAVLDGIADSVVVADGGAVVLSNTAARRALGLDPTGQSVERWLRGHECLLADGATPCPPAERPLARALTGATVDGAELYLRVPGGGGFWASATARPILTPLGAVRGAVVVFRDVSAARQAQAALRQSEERYRNVVEAASQGIVIHQDWRVRYANPASARLFGYDSPRDLIGREWESLVAPEAREALLARGVACLRGERLPPQPTWQGLRQDGTRLWVESTENLIPWEGRSAVAHFLNDVTERHRVEEHALQAQKMEAVGQLAGGVAHDFNNLLTVINGYAELLQRQCRPDDPARRLAQGIIEAGERATGLTRQLLAFSRKQVLEPRVLDLNALVRDAAGMLGRLIGEHIELRTDLEPGVDRVRADPGQLEQVIMNLVVNARDAMPAGGRITIATANVELAGPLTGGRGGRFVALAVNDTGCGMTEEVKARIFEPFFTTKGPGRGTGLGLATVYAIVRANHGHIEVESTPGRGTRFRICLPPTAEAAADHWPPRAALAQAPRGTETVLLVEDDDGVRLVSRHVLQAQGYTVLEAVHGQAAVEICGRHRTPIHLLVTDVVMPQMGGRELAQVLLQYHPEMRVLYLSGYPENGMGPADAREDVGFLQKPFKPAALADKVRRMLDQRLERPGGAA
jgi:PAS domain S-box-containing protein